MQPSHRIYCDTGEKYTVGESDKEVSRLIEIGILFPGKDVKNLDFTASGNISNFPIALFKTENKVSLFYENPEQNSKRPTHKLKVIGREYTDKDDKKRNEILDFAVLWHGKKLSEEAARFHGFGTIKQIPVQLLNPDNRIVIFPIKKKDQE